METEFLQLCKTGAADKVAIVLAEKRVNVNMTDPDGMTPLMHAAFEGHPAVCKCLLDNGAEVNTETPKEWYTALMFGTIAGRARCVEALLHGGADTEKKNKLGKSAANMGAFLGQKECQRVINNFLPFKAVEYYSQPRGLDQTDFLPPNLAPLLHTLIIMNNMNPVKLLLYFKEHPELVSEDNKLQVDRTMEKIIDKEFKDNINEVMALKLHYIQRLFAEVHSNKDGLDGCIKHFLLGRKLDGFPINVEQFVRNCIRTFKFTGSNLVAQLVRTLAPINPGSGKPALYFLMSMLNGRHVDIGEFACRTCGEMDAEKRCSACKQVFYCDATCQKMHWFTHKKVCEELSKRKPKCRPADEQAAPVKQEIKQEQQSCDEVKMNGVSSSSLDPNIKVKEEPGEIINNVINPNMNLNQLNMEC